MQRNRNTIDEFACITVFDIVVPMLWASHAVTLPGDPTSLQNANFGPILNFTARFVFVANANNT
ncbi:hypothetical protein WT54_02860 [Burkholderia territorii]|nr:hypothetical protein WT54_02860 [Burkholderia territorii]KWH06001.1 hypothetical protein WT59_24565 [Burkholderia territorii]